MDMIKVVVCICVFFCVKFSHSQTLRTVKLADSIIHEGTFKVAITAYKFPEEIRKLQEKAIESLKKDPAWSDKYIVRLVERGDKEIHFMDAYGLTKEEFNIMLAGFRRGTDVVLSDTDIITIKKLKGIISFQTKGEYSLFNYLKINTNQNIISFDKLILQKEIDIYGKFYAPGLRGFESFRSSGSINSVLQKKVSYFGLSVGINDGDIRPCLALIYGTGSTLTSNPQILIVTIF